MSSAALKMVCVIMHLLCMCVYSIHVHVYAHRHVYIFRTLRFVHEKKKKNSHLKLDIVVHIKPVIRIGTLVVVYKRAVIEGHSYVRLVEAKGIIPNAQARRKVFRQKQSNPAANHYLVFVERASCKHS